MVPILSDGSLLIYEEMYRVGPRTMTYGCKTELSTVDRTQCCFAAFSDEIAEALASLSDSCPESSREQRSPDGLPSKGE